VILIMGECRAHRRPVASPDRRGTLWCPSPASGDNCPTFAARNLIGRSEAEVGNSDHRHWHTLYPKVLVALDLFRSGSPTRVLPGTTSGVPRRRLTPDGLRRSARPTLRLDLVMARTPGLKVLVIAMVPVTADRSPVCSSRISAGPGSASRRRGHRAGSPIAMAGCRCRSRRPRVAEPRSLIPNPMARMEPDLVRRVLAAVNCAYRIDCWLGRSDIIHAHVAFLAGGAPLRSGSLK
jgi:hypothetical protein